jgi:hypothetical protein
MTQIVDAITRHQVNINRFAEGQAKRALPVLKALAKDLRQRIMAGGTEFQLTRMARLETEIRQVIGQRINEYQLALDLEDFAGQELAYTTRVLSGYVSADLASGLSADMAANIVTKSKARLLSGSLKKSMSIPDLFAEFDEATAKQTMRIMQAGVVEGKTTEQIARQVGEGALTRTRAQATATTRTAINHIGTQARKEVYAANDDILEGERFLSTLDSHTTLTCAGYDRQEFAVGKGPMPPLHYNCRSIRIPVVKPEYRKDTMGERASADGPVSNQTTYGGWLKGQSKEFQADVLGARRAELFRSGKLSIDKFTDSGGRVLTLEQLAQRYDIEVF